MQLHFQFVYFKSEIHFVSFIQRQFDRRGFHLKLVYLKHISEHAPLSTSKIRLVVERNAHSHINLVVSVAHRWFMWPVQVIVRFQIINSIFVESSTMRINNFRPRSSILVPANVIYSITSYHIKIRIHFHYSKSIFLWWRSDVWCANRSFVVRCAGRNMKKTIIQMSISQCCIKFSTAFFAKVFRPWHWI